MQQRIAYLDTVRLVAMTLMIICNACDPFNAGGRVASALQNFTICGFGIYMIHYFFVGPTYHLPFALRVPAAAILILALSWAVVALVKRLFPRSKWLLG